jgi:hypothetical protein
MNARNAERTEQESVYVWLVGANNYHRPATQLLYCAARPFAVSLINILYMSAKHESKQCNAQRVVCCQTHCWAIFLTRYVCMYVCNNARGAKDTCSAPERCWTVWRTFAMKCLQTELNVIGCFRKWELSVSWYFVWYEWTASDWSLSQGSPTVKKTLCVCVCARARAWALGMMVKPWQLGCRGSLGAVATRVVWVGWDNSVGIATCYLIIEMVNIPSNTTILEYIY